MKIQHAGKHSYRKSQVFFIKRNKNRFNRNKFTIKYFRVICWVKLKFVSGISERLPLRLKHRAP